MRKMSGISFSIVLTVMLELTVTLRIFAQPEFRPASFSGLTIGSATIAALRQVFGKPVDMNQDNSDTTWLHYRNIGPVPGTVEIQADSKSQVIRVISVVPDNLTVQAAETLYGRDFRVIRYAFD